MASTDTRTVPNISTCLWFDGRGREAAEFYAALFPNSHVAPATPGFPLTQFWLDGRPFQALDGGPGHPHTWAMSLSVDCTDQAELDHYWNGLLAGGGQPSRCGWLQDQFGVWWQVVPRVLVDLVTGPDRARAERVFQTMLGMTKLDFAPLEAA